MKLNKNHPLYQEDLNGILQTHGMEQLRGKRVVMTGATGLIGICLIDALMLYNRQYAADVHIIALGRNKATAASVLGEYFDDPLFCFVEHNALNPLPDSISADYIIPLASNTHPLAYSTYPVETMLTNLKGAEHALAMARRQHATVLYPSTVEVYGNARGEDVFTEDYTGALNLSTARSCYTESKRTAEALCLSYIEEYGITVKIARLSRVFGPTMKESDSKASSQFIKKALAGDDIVLKSKGEQFFSYTYVADAVSALLHILFNGECGVAYNVSTPTCDIHLRDFAALCAAFRDKQVVFDLPTATEQKGFSVATKAILENSRLRTLGWQSRYDIQDAVRRTLDILSD